MPVSRARGKAGNGVLASRNVGSIRYRVEIADLHAHLFRVTLTVARPSAAQRVSLPVWIPGSYLVREFSRNLQRLEAHQDGRALKVLQLDKCTWALACSADAPLVLGYEVYAFDNSVRSAWLDMHICDMAGAIGFGGDRIEQRGTDDVADLDAGMVFTVTKGRKFRDPAIDGRRCAKLLCKDRVRHIGVLPRVAAVGDTDSKVVLRREIGLEIGIEALDR